MSKVKYNIAVDFWRGAIDSRKTGQAKRERLISRYRKGSASHHVYPMQMHEGPWAEGATHNRELIKTAQREAHAIERAAKHPELATPEYINLANEWQQRFADYKATKKPGDRQYATLYTYTYSHLYRELKVGEVLDVLAKARQAKEATYQTIIPQIQALVAGETDMIANMANIAAVLHETFHFWWTGFYIVKDENERTKEEGPSAISHQPSTISCQPSAISKELVLGPFQGPIACTRIPYGKGVCGTAWAKGETVIVPNVHEFPGHIACSSESKSEIVVPIFRQNGTGKDIEGTGEDTEGTSGQAGKEVIAVLDIDSAEFNTFDAIDQKYLEQITL